MTIKWNSKIENFLKENQIKCNQYSILNEKESVKFSKLNKIMSIVSITISSALATTSTISATLENTNTMFMNFLSVATPIGLYFSAGLKSVQQILGLEKQAEIHRTASLRFRSISTNINRTLSLEPEDRQLPDNYLNWISSEIENVFNETPSVSDKTILQFSKDYGIEVEIHDNKNEVVDSFQMKELNQENDIVPESQKIRYELDRFIVNSYSGNENRI